MKIPNCSVLFLATSPDQRCWSCQHEELKQSYGVLAQYDSHRVLYLVCSPSCAARIADEMSDSEASVSILSPAETKSLLESRPRIEISVLEREDSIFFSCKQVAEKFWEN